MTSGGTIAVLTGDIVDSSGLERRAEQPVSALITSTGQKVQKHFQAEVHGQIDVFRGDSWQVAVKDPSRALRIGLYFRSLLRSDFGIDSRVSIGFGDFDYLPAENISTGTGQAFTLSGQGLEACLKPIRMSLSFPAGSQDLGGGGLQIITQLLDLQAGRWTAGQSQAMAGALLTLTQAEIAASWQPESISQQAVSQHLENAGWTQIKAALVYLEETIPTAW